MGARRGKEADKKEMRLHRLLYLGLWLLSLAGISFYGGAVSYGFFWGLTLLPAVSLLYILCVYFRFKIYQELDNRSMVCGEPTGYFFVLRNEDYFAFTGVSVRLFSDFSYVEELPGDTEYELLPGDSFTYETRLVCRYRGEYEVGIKEVAVTDFMRLLRIRYRNPGTVKALVRPRLVRLSELKGLEDFQTILQREIFSDAESDILVREYVEGDPLKNIHWKATAREGKLMTRTRTGEEKQGIVIFCDMRRFGRKPEEYLPLENRILEVFLALGYFFAGRETGFTAYYRQGAIVREQVQGVGDFDGFYRRMSQVRFGEEGELPKLLEQCLAQGGLWNSQAVFLVLHQLDSRIMEVAERLAAGTAVAVYAVTDDDIRDYIKQGSGKKKIIQIPVEESLEGRL